MTEQCLLNQNPYPFGINQIVRGKVAGVFILLGYRTVAGEILAQLMQVNPRNIQEVWADLGELALPVDCLRNYYD